MAFQCAKCRFAVEEVAHLQEMRRSFGRGAYHLCHDCWRLQTERGQRRQMIGYLMAALFAAVLWAFKPSAGFAAFTLNLAFVYFSSLPATALHEIGHALAGKLVGWRVYAIQIGWYGKPIFKKVISGVTWQLNSVPLGGFAYVFPPNAGNFRIKALLVYLSGQP